MTSLILSRTTNSWLPLYFWAACAVVSVTAATIVAVQPGQLEDLWIVHGWVSNALRGVNPYVVHSDLDYPPHAFGLLLFVRWLPDQLLAPVFLITAVSATAAATWILSGWLAGKLGITLTTRDRLVLVAIMLAGSTLRGAMWRGQLAPLAFLFGACALAYAERSPRRAAVFLALCAFKPHVAIGFALAIFVTEGVRILIAALAVALLLMSWMAYETSYSLAGLLATYIENLQHLYDGPDRVRGLLSIRWVIEDTIGSYDTATLMWVGAAVLSAALLFDAALATGNATHRARIATAFLVWALVFLPHQLYHGFMAMPALWLLMWPEGGLIRSQKIRTATVGAFIFFGVLDVPRLIRLVTDIEADWALVWLSYALSPMRVTLLFGLLLWIIARGRPARITADAAA